MFAHSFLICVLVGSVLQTSLCQDTKTGDGGKEGDGVKGGGANSVPKKAPVILPEEVVNKYKESITWDAQTANPHLVLSGDWKTVTLSNISQNIDNNTERFDKDPSILGSAGYQSGKHYFVMGGNGGWLVGVAAESVERKGYLFLDPSSGIYAMPKSIDEDPEKAGIFLDCDAGQVSICDAATREVSLSFVINCTEPIHPFALIGKGSLTAE